MKKILLLYFAVALSYYAQAQQRTITGKVTSPEDGSALPGVNVLVKGTTNGTVTDSGGQFSLTVPGADAVLSFSFIGLASTEVTVGENTVLNVEMESDITQLSEVVVTGAGVATEKRKLGISVESLTAADLPQAPTASIDQALIGKIPGAQIT